MLRREEGLQALDLRAIATELEASSAPVWRVALQRRAGLDGYVAELGGDIDRSAQDRVRASLEELKRDMPGIVVGTVNDAGERGMLGIRGWRN